MSQQLTINSYFLEWAKIELFVTDIKIVLPWLNALRNKQWSETYLPHFDQIWANFVQKLANFQGKLIAIEIECNVIYIFNF